VLYFVFKATQEDFRTAWFMESLLTETLILLVIRTRRPFLKSHPARVLLLAVVLTFCASVLLPYLPFVNMFQFSPLPFSLLATILFITLLYVLVAEMIKQQLFKKANGLTR
jgi:Mg2+-importing ATPase